jgi:glutamine amidotransferase
MRFYFAHSYHVLCGRKEDIVATTGYGYDFVSIFKHDNITGVQFHPEKSHTFGRKLLDNFIGM